MSKYNSACQLETLGATVLAGFFANFSSSQKQIEQSLLMLEMSSDDSAILLELQQGVAQIQQCLLDIGLDNIQPLTTSLNR